MLTAAEMAQCRRAFLLFDRNSAAVGERDARETRGQPVAAAAAAAACMPGLLAVPYTHPCTPGPAGDGVIDMDELRASLQTLGHAEVSEQALQQTLDEARREACWLRAGVDVLWR